MRKIFASLCADFEAELVRVEGEDVHVHWLVNFPPKTALTKLVNSLTACPEVAYTSSAQLASPLLKGLLRSLVCCFLWRCADQRHSAIHQIAVGAR